MIGHDHLALAGFDWNALLDFLKTVLAVWAGVHAANHTKPNQ